jgi:hypothetical protein
MPDDIVPPTKKGPVKIKKKRVADLSIQADDSIFKPKVSLVSVGCGSMCIDESI